MNARPAHFRGRVKYLRRHSRQKDTAPTSTQGRSADWDPSPSQLGQCSQRHTFGENVFSDLTISSLITSQKKLINPQEFPKSQLGSIHLHDYMPISKLLHISRIQSSHRDTTITCPWQGKWWSVTTWRMME